MNARGSSIKGTDDYLTARGANPFTGLVTPFTPPAISPEEQRPTDTPGNPGEALERRIPLRRSIAVESKHEDLTAARDYAAMPRSMAVLRRRRPRATPLQHSMTAPNLNRQARTSALPLSMTCGPCDSTLDRPPTLPYPDSNQYTFGTVTEMTNVPPQVGLYRHAVKQLQAHVSSPARAISLPHRLSQIDEEASNCGDNIVCNPTFSGDKEVPECLSRSGSASSTTTIKRKAVGSPALAGSGRTRHQQPEPADQVKLATADPSHGKAVTPQYRRNITPLGQDFFANDLAKLPKIRLRHPSRAATPRSSPDTGRRDEGLDNSDSASSTKYLRRRRPKVDPIIASDPRLYGQPLSPSRHTNGAFGLRTAGSNDGSPGPWDIGMLLSTILALLVNFVFWLVAQLRFVLPRIRGCEDLHALLFGVNLSLEQRTRLMKRVGFQVAQAVVVAYVAWCTLQAAGLLGRLLWVVALPARVLLRGLGAFADRGT